MFEKLLSVLPYNPGLLPQMSFYSRRMREEASIRRIGMVFIVLAFMVQFFAVLSPPQSTSAASGSNNDLIQGGISSAADARAQCERNTQGYQEILHHYGISCNAFDSATSLTIHANASNDYWSAGHIDYGFPEDQSITLHSGITFHWRHLNSFGNAAYENTLRIKNQDGKVFYVLHDCANLVSIGKPTASPLNTPTPPATPKPTPPQTPPPTTPTPPPTVPVCPYNSSIPLSSPQCFQPCPYNASIPISSGQCFKPCPYNNAISVTSESCKPCDKSTTSQDAVACIIIHKAASNITTNVSDANNTTAKPGDVITYTLSAKNNGKAKIERFTFEENLSDVLDYADVTDLQGGAMDSVKNVKWPAESIAAGATTSHQVTVKVKDPVPQTPVDPGDPGHFNLIMTNVYGDTVNIKVPGSPAKTIETTTTALPNTGPGTSLFVASMIVIAGGYFYGRARLLAKESMIAVQETASA